MIRFTPRAASKCMACSCRRWLHWWSAQEGIRADRWSISYSLSSSLEQWSPWSPSGECYCSCIPGSSPKWWSSWMDARHPGHPLVHLVKIRMSRVTYILRLFGSSISLSVWFLKTVTVLWREERYTYRILCSVLLPTADNMIWHILSIQVDAHWR